MLKRLEQKLFQRNFSIAKDLKLSIHEMNSFYLYIRLERMTFQKSRNINPKLSILLSLSKSDHDNMCNSLSTSHMIFQFFIFYLSLGDKGCRIVLNLGPSLT